MHAFHRRLGAAMSTVGAAVLALLCHGALAQDNNATIAIGYQRGLAYLPVILMEQQRLFEKHASTACWAERFRRVSSARRRRSC